MTFYNIIFGILFLGALREVVRSLAQPEHPGFWQAVTLSLLVFSDTVYTSEVIEEKQRPYSVWMKLTDLGNFVLLTFAILAIDPTAENMLQLDVRPFFGGRPLEPVFWSLLALYWLGLILWNVAGRMYVGVSARLLRWVQPAFCGLSVLMVVLSSYAPAHGATAATRPIVAVLALAYLILYKPLLTGRMTRLS